MDLIYFVEKPIKTNRYLHYMPSKTYKYSSFFLILIFLVFTSCTSFNYGDQRKTDRFKETMASKGNKMIDSVSLTDRFASMFEDNSGMKFSESITYEVALKQFSIMPLVSADKVGGTIITDWYSTASNNDERIKFNIFILNEEMTSESINIKMFKEIFTNNTWITSVVDKNTSEKIKSVILKKALQLKAAAELS